MPPVTEPQTCHASGRGILEFTRIGSHTVPTRIRANSPLKLLLPQMNNGCAWAYTSTYGGGLVAGDTINLTLHLNANASCLLSTQASTKVYASPQGRPCRQSLTATIDEGALLTLLPDPVTCFTQAVYEQNQRFNLATGGSIAILDWFTSGRRARDERWAFSKYQTRNAIFINNKLRVADALLLDSKDGPLDAPHRLGDYDCVAAVLLVGPKLTSAATSLTETIGRQPVERAGDLLCAVSPIEQGAIMRLAGKSTAIVADCIRQKLGFLNDLVGQDPWSRKW